MSSIHNMECCLPGSRSRSAIDIKAQREFKMEGWNCSKWTNRGVRKVPKMVTYSEGQQVGWPDSGACRGCVLIKQPVVSEVRLISSNATLNQEEGFPRNTMLPVVSERQSPE